jgi:hypothetical protein
MHCYINGNQLNEYIIETAATAATHAHMAGKMWTLVPRPTNLKSPVLPSSARYPPPAASITDQVMIGRLQSAAASSVTTTF